MTIRGSMLLLLHNVGLLGHGICLQRFNPLLAISTWTSMPSCQFSSHPQLRRHSGVSEVPQKQQAATPLNECSD